MNDNLVPRAFSLALGAGPWERGPWERGCMNEASSRTGAWGSLYPSSMIDVYFFSLSLFFPVSGRILEMRKKIAMELINRLLRKRRPENADPLFCLYALVLVFVIAN